MKKLRAPGGFVALVACLAMTGEALGHSTAPAVPPRLQTSRAVANRLELDPDGLGVAKYGQTLASTTKAITAVLGPPTGHPASGCTAEYKQAAWRDLIVQFVGDRFTGYRYLDGGDRGVAPTAAIVRSVEPRVATASGIGLGSSLSEVRRAYRDVRRVATQSYRSPAGIVFSFWSTGNPVGASRLYEIKSNVCPAST
jgi:hypothetical protein